MPLTISLTPGALPADGDLITNATLRSIAQPTVALEGSIGTASLSDGSVTTAKLAANVLTADTTGRGKMADGFVDTAKLASDAVTTVKILDGNVTAAKLDEATQQGRQLYAAATLTAGVYAFTLSPVPTAYTAGLVVRFKADVVNAGATDLNVNALGAKNLFTLDGKELVAGQIPAGALIEATYDGTNFQCNLRSRFVSAETAVTSAGVILDTAHGLGAAPGKIQVVLVNRTTTEFGYADGDELDAGGVNRNQMPAFHWGADATKVFLLMPSTTLIAANRSTGAQVTLTNARWKAKIYAEL